MILGSIACVFLGILNVLYLLEILPLLNLSGEYLANTVDSDGFLYLVLAVTYIFVILLCLAETIVFMLFGIKLIINSKKPIDNYKTIVITSLILGYVGAGLAMGSELLINGLIFALLLSAAIILSVALSRNKKTHQSDVFGNRQESVINCEELNNEDIQTQLYSNELTHKIQSLQQLKDTGVINNEEYVTLIHKVLGIGDTNTSTTKSRKKTNKGDKDEG